MQVGATGAARNTAPSVYVVSIGTLSAIAIRITKVAPGGTGETESGSVGGVIVRVGAIGTGPQATAIDEVGNVCSGYGTGCAVVSCVVKALQTVHMAGDALRVVAEIRSGAGGVTAVVE